MSNDDGLKFLTEHSKKTSLKIHEDKSDEELFAIIDHNHAIIMATQDSAQAANLLGELQACKEIVDRRFARSNRIDEDRAAISHATSLWQEDLSTRKLNAIGNLPVAASYYGQLVTAILEEEDGLTAGEIRQWSEDLMAMDDKQFAKLLEDLGSEQVIFKENGNQYYLLGICTGSLLPVNPQKWVERICKKKGIKLLSLQESFLARLYQTRLPATEYEWIDIETHNQDLRNSKIDKLHRNVRIPLLEDLVSYGILMKYPIPKSHCSFYYFPLLGEEEAK